MIGTSRIQIASNGLWLGNADHRDARGESQPTFRRSSCLARCLRALSIGVEPANKPVFRSEGVGVESPDVPLVRSSNFLAAGVKISRRLGVDADNLFMSRCTELEARGARGVEAPNSSAFLDKARPASLPSLRPSESREFGAFITKGDGATSVVSSEPPRTLGVASKVPIVISSRTSCGPNSVALGAAIGSTNPNPRILGESERGTSKRLTLEISGELGKQ